MGLQVLRLQCHIARLPPLKDLQSTVREGLLNSLEPKLIFITTKSVTIFVIILLVGQIFLLNFRDLEYLSILLPSGSVISYNDVLNNDAGIGVFGNSNCCEIDHNLLRDNRFFGIIIGEGEHTISNTQITGGNVGVLAVAFSVDTVATLNRVAIVGATTPTQELSVGSTAEVIFAPRSVQTAQSTTLTDNPISFALPTPAYADISK